MRQLYITGNRRPRTRQWNMHVIAVEKDYQRPVMIASLLVSLLMLGGKLTAYYLTGSAAILSDAIESVIHLLATGFAAYSLWYSVKPADEQHPYGHGKIAYFSSGFEGGLIMTAALGILYTATADLIRGPEVHSLSIGLLITGGLALVNMALGTALVRTGKKHNSIVLIANGHHVFTDMWTSFGVIIGLSLVWMTDFVWLDPVVAILVALNILRTAGSLMKRAYDGLMEAADPAETVKIVELLDGAIDRGVIEGYHQLRHRRVNDRLWIEYHLLFSDHESMRSAHGKSHRVEDALHQLFSDDRVVVTAHMEPGKHDDAHTDWHPEPDTDALGVPER